MKKIFLKAGIPLLLMVVLVIIVALTQKSIEKKNFQRIEAYDFNEYVSQFITDSIENQSLVDAKLKYDQIYRIISVEESITLTKPSGRSPLLSRETAKDCYERIFFAFYSILDKNATTCFSGSIWNEKELDRIREYSRDLLKRNGINSKKQKLEDFRDVVTGYYSAKQLIKTKSYICTDVKSYNNLCNEATKYTKDPYSNCKKLANILTIVKQNASNSWRMSIEEENISLCSKSNHEFYSYEDFYNYEYKNMYSKIGEYVKNIGNADDWEKTQKSKLEAKRESVQKYFSPLNNENF